MSERNIPNHVAIIPDGNRRWAKKRGMDSWIGHEYGAKNTELLIRKAFNMGVKYISFWGSSLENLKKRPFQEKKALLGIYEKYFSSLIDSEEIHNNKIRINFVGKWEEQFPGKLKDIIHKCIQKTKDYKNNFLNFFLAYNGDDEMIEAVKNIVKKYKPGQEVTSDLIKENLMTRDIPPVDFLVRTGGEPHLSAGFMMWDIANSQMYFSEILYPDFKEEEFEKAIGEFEKRERRLGK
ncbi:MAG: polyprenyl diphosphate synthase [Parcubacteria group bacterium]|jgi:undecaprenyl diphosphate synthase